MRFSMLCAALAVALSALVAPAHASILGVAGEFNGFVFGNLTSHGQDTEGRLAVGGNLVASSYAVGSGGIGPAVPITNPRTDVLVVGGDLNAQTNWQVFNGNAVWGTSITGVTHGEQRRDCARQRRSTSRPPRPTCSPRVPIGAPCRPMPPSSSTATRR